MCGGSKADSSSKQTTSQQENTLSSIGSSGDVIKAESLTINEQIPEGLVDIVGSLASLTESSVKTATEALSQGISEQNEIKIEEVTPGTSAFSSLSVPLIAGAIVTGVVLITTGRK